jgi:hypoxanthine phosphoribosyltransferase
MNPDLFQFGWFASHSGFQLPWKFDSAALSDGSIDALARLISGKIVFGAVYGIPRGGERLAEALCPSATAGYPLLIVDDVLTTGRSMREARARLTVDRPIGVVILARGECPDWVWPILSVNEWAQSRGTGLG